MKHGVGLGLALMAAASAACGVVEAADPPARRPPATATATAPAPAKSTKPLDLRVGNFRKYMMPKDYRAAIGQPDADKDTVVVEGQRVLVPMEHIENVPPGLGAFWYAAKHPLNSWRLFAPMVNAPPAGPPSPVPPPVFRRGP
jgi:hypothetical protein